jgi:hypothetical protein
MGGLHVKHAVYAHMKNICRNSYVNVDPNKATAQIQGLMREFAYLNAGLLARNQFASGRSCDRSNRSRFSVVFLDPMNYL